MRQVRQPRVIVLGNEKGGSGKSTTAMHLIVALRRLGYSVACLDLDTRQRSLSRYVENRRKYCLERDADLPMPEYQDLQLSDEDSKIQAVAEDAARLEKALADLLTRNQLVVIDCPGRDSALARYAHGLADILITPLNDSFVDFDLLAQIDSKTFSVKGPSRYSEMVWRSRKERVMRDGGTIDWFVMRNRLSHVDSRNKRRMSISLEELARRIGYKLLSGFGERVIFRELFPLGLTVLDMAPDGGEAPLTMSHVAARQEVRDLVAALDLVAPVAPVMKGQLPLPVMTDEVALNG